MQYRRLWQQHAFCSSLSMKRRLVVEAEESHCCGLAESGEKPPIANNGRHTKDTARLSGMGE